MTATTASPIPATAIRPQPGAQEMFLSTPADIAIFGGARGPGKTFALLLESVRHATVKSFTAVMFRRTYPEVTQAGGLWQQSFDLYPALGGRVRQDAMTWRFPAGATVKFAHMQYETDRLTWKGAQIALLAFDQLEGFTADQFWFLTSCLRSTSGVRPYVRAACNPVPDDDATGGWLHRLLAWWIDARTGLPIAERGGVVRWFVRDPETDAIEWADDPASLRARHEGSAPQSFTFVPGRLEDNAILEARDPGYRMKLLNLPRVERLRAFGNWTVRPTAGSVFDRSWFEIIDVAPAEAQRVRAWDKAGTAGGGDWSAGVRLARAPSGVWVVEDVVRGQWSSLDRNRVMRQVAADDGIEIEIEIEQEPGSGGKESAEISVRELAGYRVRARPVTGDLVTRAGPFAAQAEAMNVKLVHGPWTEAYLRELHEFPDGAHDDQVAASAGAFNRMALRGDRSAPRLVVLGGVGGHGRSVAEHVKKFGMYWPASAERAAPTRR